MVCPDMQWLPLSGHALQLVLREQLRTAEAGLIHLQAEDTTFEVEHALVSAANSLACGVRYAWLDPGRTRLAWIRGDDPRIQREHDLEIVGVLA